MFRTPADGLNENEDAEDVQDIGEIELSEDDAIGVFNTLLRDTSYTSLKDAEYVPQVYRRTQSIGDSVLELQPEEVRWMYKFEDQKKWHPFIGYDSLRIECEYRKSLQLKPDELPEMISVRGGLYEVNIVMKKCTPVFWTTMPKTTTLDRMVKRTKNDDDTADIMRATWFLDTTWEPLDEAYSEKIEASHLEKFLGQKVTNPKEEATKPSALHTLKFKEFHVEWTGIDKVKLHYENTSSKLYRAVGSKLGLSKSGTGTRIQRGYRYEAKMDDKPADITHLVFVIHGIGQKYETGAIFKTCSNLRENARQVTHKHFKDLHENNERIEFLPVEWRSKLKLDGDLVDTITPQKVKGIRSFLNATAMDIMYYTSPMYREEITSGLRKELNRLYSLFCERNPYFEASGGKVSLMAHSLGSVICYDIMTGWNPIQQYDQYVTSVIENEFADDTTKNTVAELEKARSRVNQLEEKLIKEASKHHTPKLALNFKVDCYFCVGSPLAVFLTLRGIRPIGQGSQEYILPKKICRRIFNIYHPCDPVAYRIEPLIVKNYATFHAVRIHRCENPYKEPYDLMPAKVHSKSSPKKQDNEKALNGADEMNDKKAGWGGMFKRWGRKNTDVEGTSAELCEMKYSSSQESVSTKNLEQTVEATDLEARIDFELPQGKMETTYIATLTSHLNYWTNADLALFLLTQVFPDYGTR